jgi:MFS family permease
MTGTDAATGRNGLPVTATVTVLLTGFIAATYGFGIYLFPALVPDMRADLGFGYTGAGIVTAAAQIGFLAFALLGGLLAPRIGGGRVVLGSAALCGACLALLPLAGDILTVGILLTLLGGCSASVYVPMVELVARLVPYGHRGKVLGLVSSGTSYGVFVNGLLVPVFVMDGNWRGAWLAAGAATLLLTLVAAAVFLRLGLLRAPPGRSTRLPATGGKGRRVTRAGLTVWAITFLNGFALLPFQTYLSPYLRDELGFPVTVAGQVWTVIGFVGMGAGFAVGALSDRIGIRASLVLTYALVLTASLLVALVPAEFAMIGAATAFALAFYPIFGLVPAYIGKTLSGAQATMAFGIANVTLGLGGMLGNLLGGWSRTGTGTFVWIYLAVAAAALVLAALAAALPAEGRRSEP